MSSSLLSELTCSASSHCSSERRPLSSIIEEAECRTRVRVFNLATAGKRQACCESLSSYATLSVSSSRSLDGRLLQQTRRRALMGQMMRKSPSVQRPLSWRVKMNASKASWSRGKISSYGNISRSDEICVFPPHNLDFPFSYLILA